MRRTVLLCLILLASCSRPEPVQVEEEMRVQESVPEEVQEVLEKPPLLALPEELSLEYLSSMPLAGTGFTLEDVLASNDSYTRHAIGYFSNSLWISGILNIPHGDGPFPLLILNHGYIDPAVYTRGRGLKREQDYFARNGFAVLHADYRGHAESDESPDESMVYDGMLEYSMDIYNAIDAIKAADFPAIDTDRIGMLGHSMGGGITMNLAVTYPGLSDAIVLYAPVHIDAWENFSRWRADRDPGDRTVDVLDTRESDPENWNALSPDHYLSRVSVPVLLFHGTQDGDVPLAWSEYAENRLREEEKQIEFIVYENEKHEFINKWPQFMQQSREFFETQL